MKPKFILFLGVGWSATTPLFASIKEHLLYGIEKEWFYPHMLFERNCFKFKDDHLWRESLDELKVRIKKFREGEIQFHHVSKHNVSEKALRIIEHYDPTIERYIDFYKCLWEEKGCNQTALADFTNTTSECLQHGKKGVEWYKKFVSKLNEHFDVTQVAIFRDPVRRFFSNECWLYDNAELVGASIGKRSIKDWFEHRIEHQIPYAKLIKTAMSCGKTEFFVMEDVWESDTETQVARLQKLLTVDRVELYDNAYCPDRGSKAIRYSCLIDQWTSDSFDMPDNLYYKLKEMMSFQYEDWIEMYGKLPETWGSPADYEKNQSLPIGRLQHKENFVYPESYEEIDGQNYWKINNT